MSRAVLICSSFGRPEALRKIVFFMPIRRAVLVISLAKFSSVPARFSAIVAAMSLAERVTRDLIASAVVIVAPAFRPNLVGGWLAACGVTTSSVFAVILPAFM